MQQLVKAKKNPVVLFMRVGVDWIPTHYTAFTPIYGPMCETFYYEGPYSRSKIHRQPYTDSDQHAMNGCMPKNRSQITSVGLCLQHRTVGQAEVGQEMTCKKNSQNNQELHDANINIFWKCFHLSFGKKTIYTIFSINK